MSNFPVDVLNFNTNITLDDICREEGMPMAGSAFVTAFPLVTNSNVLDVNFRAPGALGGITPNFFPVIKTLRILSNIDIRIGMRVDNAGSNVFKGDNDNTTPTSYTRVNTVIHLKANVVYELRDTNLLNFGYMGLITFVNTQFLTAENRTIDLSVDWSGFSITKNTDISANKVMLGVGDSIMFGTGAGYFEDLAQEPYFQNVKKSLIEKGYRVRGVNKAISSMTSSSICRAINWGFYNVRAADLILIVIGANDADNLGAGGLGVVANQTIFTNNINYIINFFNKRFPDAKILMCGSTPSSINATETRIETGRAIIQQCVTSFNKDNVKYLSLATAFDRTNTANYLPSDTIHPTAQNDIANVIKARLLALNWFQ